MNNINPNEDIPQLEFPENYGEQETGDGQTDGGGGDNNVEQPKGFVAWIIAGLSTAISAVSVTLYTVLLNSNNKLQKDYDTAKVEYKKEVKEERLKADSLQKVLDNCDNLDELRIKFEKAQALREVTASDFTKINKEIQLARENTQNFQKAAQNVEKAIKNNKK